MENDSRGRSARPSRLYSRPDFADTSFQKCATLQKLNSLQGKKVFKLTADQLQKYAGVYDSLHKVTALMFSENPKEPALIISSFRKEANNEKPVLKAAFINGDVYMGDNQLVALTKIKTKNELIGEVIGLLQSPAKRVLAALLHHHEKQAAGAPAAEAPAAPAAE